MILWEDGIFTANGLSVGTSKSPRLPFEEIKQILAPVGGKGPHFHRIADAIRQGRGGIGSPSADLVEWLNGVSPTFGWLYSTAFALAGFESVM